MVWTVLMILFVIGTLMLITWSFGHLKETLEEEAEVKKRSQPQLGDKTEKEFYDSGALKKEVTFRNGVPIGIGHEYFPDGRLQKAYNFMNGTKEYLTKEYNAQGQLTVEEYFKLSRLIRRKEFDKDGHVTSEKHLAG